MKRWHWLFAAFGGAFLAVIVYLAYWGVALINIISNIDFGRLGH